MTGPRLGLLALVMVILAGCESLAPPFVPPPGLSTPAPEAEPPPPLAAPLNALQPRRQWRRIPLARDARMASAYVASDIVTNPDGTRRVWMVVNLLEPIRLPETGGTARSAAYIADFRCDPHAWSPILGIWYRQPNAVGEALREPTRGPAGIREVGEGSLIDIFVNAACAGPPSPRPPRGGVR